MGAGNQHLEKMVAPEETTSQRKPERVSISVLGAEGVGKRCLVRRYCLGMYSDEYDPMDDSDGHRKQCVISDTPCLLAIDNPLPLWSSRSSEARRVARGADALVLAYDATRPESVDVLRCVEERLRPHVLGAAWLPLGVVATKADCTVGEAGLRPGRELAAQLGVSFFAVSAVTGDGVEEVVEELVAAVLRRREMGAGTELGESRKRSKLCCFS